VARKHKRSQQRKPPRRAFNASQAAPPAGGVRPLMAPDAATTTPQPALRRRPSQLAPLPPQDASIPLERVPYFRKDIRRIGITAALMFGLLVAGSFFIR